MREIALIKRSAVILKIILVAVLFADSANLTDLFRDTITIHFEEVKGDEPSLCFSRFDSEIPQVAEAANPSGQDHDYESRTLVVVDQDSPALVGSLFSLASITLAFRAGHFNMSYERVPRSCLYLWNHVLRD